MTLFEKTILPLLFALAFVALLLPAKEAFKSKEAPPQTPPPAVIEVKKTALFAPVSFDDLKGWRNDDVLQALPAMIKSCKAALAKQKPYKKICKTLTEKKFKSAKQLRAFLMQNMIPYAVHQGNEGTFTGYYEPEIPASLVKTKKFAAPVHAVPDDLTAVRLNRFLKDKKGGVIFGQAKNGEFQPYLTREEINNSDIPAKPLAYLQHKADVFVMQVQGSGVLALPDGSRMRVGYAADNGHAFTGIGGVMLKKGLLKHGADMGAVRRALIENPHLADDIMNVNKRYIFFKVNKTDGAIGSLGVSLTAERSLAVDPSYIPLGSFLWLETKNPQMNRLVCAQDTGAAIKGKIRGDFFFGTGAKAFERAKGMKSAGVYYILLPKDFNVKDIEK